MENRKDPCSPLATTYRPRNFILLLTLTFAAVMSTVVPTQAVAPPSQTILNPAQPKKSAYPKIVIYTVSWCPHCREVKEYLTSHNIPFINMDVELDPSAMDQLVQKYKTYGVPVVILGNDQEILKGFTPAEFEKAVTRVRSGSKP